MDITFSEWLQDQLSKRDWSQSDLARKSNLTRAAISRYINQERNVPDNDSLKAIAHGLDLPIETVFRAAGVLPPLSGHDPDILEGVEVLEKMPAAMRRTMVKMMKTYYKEWEIENAEPKTQPRKPGGTGPLKDPSQA